jgi:uncharacterized repeat protein (TIGR03803 family)
MTVTLIMALMLAPGAWAASTYKILHAFKRSSGGQGPEGTLISDAAGNLYGITQVGGLSTCSTVVGPGCGVVFKLTHNSDGTWTEHLLHRFTGGTDGANPSAGVILDAAGNLYGTTGSGGSSSCGCGVVFKLMPNSDGTWTEHVLHTFTGGTDGDSPNGVILDAAGNLYGTTTYGGMSCSDFGTCGVVFKLTHKPDGTWTEHVLYQFTGADGLFPSAGVILDAAGNLYGTTYNGGLPCGCGNVFKLAPNPDGTWTEHVLYQFRSENEHLPHLPVGGVILDAAGNLYGTTSSGVSCVFCGVVFKLAPNPDGTWTEHVLYSFTDGLDGGQPDAGVILDAAGNLYGTTNLGGSSTCINDEGSGCGVVFKLTHNSDGSWTEHVLHAFLGYGANPQAGLLRGASGNLYGTASGGTSNGLVFEIKP